MNIHLNMPNPHEALETLRSERGRLSLQLDELSIWAERIKDAQAALDAWENEHGDDLADLESICGEVPSYPNPFPVKGPAT